MTRENRIVKLYKETYTDESLNGITIEEMEESLEAYYQAAGFNFRTIDDILENTHLDEEFIRHMDEKTHKTLASMKQI